MKGKKISKGKYEYALYKVVCGKCNLESISSVEYYQSNGGKWYCRKCRKADVNLRNSIGENVLKMQGGMSAES